MNPILTAKLIAAGILLALLAWAGATVYSWKQDAALLPGVKQELVDVRANAATQARIAQESSDGYQKELTQLRNARRVIDSAPRPVRLCLPASPVRPAEPSPRRPDAAPTPTGNDPEAPRPGRDIGPDLYAIADQCDEMSAQLRALQEWARKVAGVTE